MDGVEVIRCDDSNNSGHYKVYFLRRYIGRIRGDIYISYRKSKYNYYIKGQGYAINTIVLDALKILGCKYIVIKEERQDDSIHYIYTKLQNYIDMPSFNEQGEGEQKCFKKKNMVELCNLSRIDIADEYFIDAIRQEEDKTKPKKIIDKKLIEFI